MAARRRSGPSARGTSRRSVNHGPSGGTSPRRRDGPSDRAAPPRPAGRPRLESERLAGQVDRGRPVRSLGAIGQQEPVAISAERVGGVAARAPPPRSARSADRVLAVAREQPGELDRVGQARPGRRPPPPPRAPHAFAFSRAVARSSPSIRAAMNPAQNASPAPTGSTTVGTARAGLEIGSPPRSRPTAPSAPHLHHRERGTQVQHGLREGGRVERRWSR